MARLNQHGGVALAPSSSLYPFLGCVRGFRAEATVRLAWAGRVRSDAGPVEALRASDSVEEALLSVGFGPDRRSALGSCWRALEQVEQRDRGAMDDLSLLLVATDEEGTSVSACGLGEILAGAAGGRATPWVRAPHPLLSRRGLPAQTPGALSVPKAPPWLIGFVEPDPLADGQPVDHLLRACGVRA